MSDEVRRVEDFLDANREKFHVKQIYSWFSEQGDAGTELALELDGPDRVKALNDQISGGRPKSARVGIGVRNSGGGQGGGPGQDVQVQLVGDSSQTLAELGRNLVPILSRRAELRDVHVDAGDQNSELSVRVDRERAAAFGFSAQEVSQFVGLALRGAPLREFRRGETEVPVWVRFAGAEDYGMADIATFMVRSPDGRTVPLLSTVDVSINPAATEVERTNRKTKMSIKASIAKDTTQHEASKR